MFILIFVLMAAGVVPELPALVMLGFAAFDMFCVLSGDYRSARK